MAKQFIDFYVKKLDATAVTTLVSYGYTHVCVEKNVLDKTAAYEQLVVHRKVLAEASTRGEVLELARRFGGRAVVSVKPIGREALMTASRDERVATVVVHSEIPEFDRHVAAVFNNAVEVAVSELIACFSDEESWRNITTFVRKAAAVGKQILVSSGAEHADQILPPHQLAMVEAAIVGKKTHDLATVSIVPSQTLRRVLR